MYYFFHLSCESYLPFTIMQWKFNMAAPMKKCSAIVYSGFSSFHPAEDFLLRLKHCRSDMQSHLLKTRLCCCQLPEVINEIYAVGSFTVCLLIAIPVVYDGDSNLCQLPEYHGYS